MYGHGCFRDRLSHNLGLRTFRTCSKGCLHDTFDVAILFAADEDYVPLVEAVKRDGRRVVHSFLDVANHGRRLRSACDDYRVITEADLTGFGPEPRVLR